MSAIRSTYYVWKALFLREILGRLFSGRAAWFWLLAEPIFHVTYLMVIFTVVRVRTIGGIHTALWLACGMFTYFMFNRAAQQGSQALNANRALFDYRQVKPVDTVLVRAFTEAFLMLFVIGLLLLGLYLFSVSSLPQDPLAVFEGLFGMWLLGLGFGLVASVASHLIPELQRILNFIMMPTYMISGVIFPISMVPQPYREWLMYNPVAHGLEAVRLGFAPYYHAVPELSIPYLYGFALVLVFFGLALHRRFAQKLVTL